MIISVILLIFADARNMKQPKNSIIMKKILTLTVLFVMGLSTLAQAENYIGLMNQTFSCNNVYSEEDMRKDIQSGPYPIPYTGNVSFNGPKRRLVMTNLNVVLDGMSYLYNYLTDSLVMEIHGNCRIQIASYTPVIISDCNMRIVCVDGGSLEFVYGGSLSNTVGVVSMRKNASILFENGTYKWSNSRSPAISFTGDYNPSTRPIPVSSNFTLTKIAPQSVVFKNCGVTMKTDDSAITYMKGYMGMLDCMVTNPSECGFNSEGFLVEADGTTEVEMVTIEPCLHFDVNNLWYNGPAGSSTVSVVLPSPSNQQYTNLGSSLTVPSTVKHNGKNYSVTGVGYKAFARCTSLQSVNLPSTIKTIGESSFYQCKKLTSMTLPSKVENIMDRAFMSCEMMTSVTIPATVTNLGDMAFRGCGNLEKIYTHIYDPTKVTYTRPSLIFNGVNKSTCVIYVPKGRIWIYWITDPWSDFNGFSEIPAANGDVNGDGKVNVSDVTTLINMILGVTPMNQSVADVNGDGKVNVSDVTALINIILGV